MKVSALIGTDLNLLVALFVLLEEQNVGKAAERMFVTQSAMSKMLARLRHTFDDDLFTRSGHGIIPTPKALELYTPVQKILQMTEDLLFIQNTNPMEFTGNVLIQTSAFYTLPLLSKLVPLVMKEAPNLNIRVIQEDSQVGEKLYKGQIDFAIVNRNQEFDQMHDVLRQKLMHTTPIILVKTEHPLTKIDNPTLQDISQYKIIVLLQSVIQSWQNSILQQSVANKLLRDNIVLETSHYFSAIDTLINSNCIMFVPKMKIDIAKKIGAITSIEIPDINDQFDIEVNLLSHKRTINSFKHKWIISKITNIFKFQDT